MRSLINEQLILSNTSPLKVRPFDYARFTYPWHFHPEFEIIHIAEGMGTAFVGNGLQGFSPGDTVLIGSSLPHYMKSDEAYHTGEEQRTRGTIIQFEKAFMHYSINHYPHFIHIKNLLEEAHQGIYFPAGCSARLAEMLERIPGDTGIDQITTFLQLLKEMSSATGTRVISTPDYSGHVMFDASRIDKVMAHLNKHYTRHIGLDEISSFAAMNPAAFCRFFKNKTGQSFKHYILDMRIGYACKLLINNDTSIAQISAECGFETISHFNRSFKKKTGYTPSDYRKTML